MANEELENREEEDKSVFNMAIANLQRLDTLINNFVIMSFEGNYNDSYRIITQLKTCLSPQLKTKNEEIKKMILETGERMKIYNKGNNNLSDEIFFRQQELFEILLNVMNDKDMLMPKKDDMHHVMLR